MVVIYYLGFVHIKRFRVLSSTILNITTKTKQMEKTLYGSERLTTEIILSKSILFNASKF